RKRVAAMDCHRRVCSGAVVACRKCAGQRLPLSFRLWPGLRRWCGPGLQSDSAWAEDLSANSKRPLIFVELPIQKISGRFELAGRSILIELPLGCALLAGNLAWFGLGVQ